MASLSLTARSTDLSAAFYKLAGRKAQALALCRDARSAELSSSATEKAKALFGADSLVLADCLASECLALNNVSMTVTGVEEEALDRKGWDVLFQALIPLLLRRLSTATLLPGTIRGEELEYAAHVRVAAHKALDKPLPSPAALRARASTI